MMPILPWESTAAVAQLVMTVIVVSGVMTHVWFGCRV